MSAVTSLYTPPRAVLDALLHHQRFLVACHVDPDPDAIGSLLAMDRILRDLGKTSVPVSPDPPPPWRVLPGFERITSPAKLPITDFDAFLVLDCEPDRTGPLAMWAERDLTVINIDHHVTNAGQAAVRWIQPEAAATGELIFHLLAALAQETRLALDADLATLLYAAIMGDTGSFRYSNSTPEVFTVASKLVTAGAKPDRLADQLLDTRPLSFLKLLAAALATLGCSDDGRIAWISLTREMFDAAGAHPDDASGMVHYARMLDGVDVALLFSEIREGEVKVSFRARGDIDVSAIAKSFGGGGHPKASGCTLAMPLDEARTAVLARVADSLH